MKHYKHIFFDLDRTLWDFEKCSQETLRQIYIKFDLNKKGIDNLEHFIETYIQNNDRLWDIYRRNEITKGRLNIERFDLTLKEFGIDDIYLVQNISKYYIDISPALGILIPNAIEILTYLTEQKYTIHIVTNGFEEIQKTKISTTGINKYINQMITSEQTGFKKPDPMFFEQALKLCKATEQESIVIGDEYEVDILGAKSYGIDQIYYNPGKLPLTIAPTYEITDLLEIKNIL